MSIVLFDATKSIKITRKARFGSGVLPYVPEYRYTDRTASDTEWLLQDEIRREEAARQARRRFAFAEGLAHFNALQDAGLSAF